MSEATTRFAKYRFTSTEAPPSVSSTVSITSRSAGNASEITTSGQALRASTRFMRIEDRGSLLVVAVREGVSMAKKSSKPAFLNEYEQQKAFIAWCRDASEKQTNLVKREALKWIHASLNGVRLTIGQATKAKRM